MNDDLQPQQHQNRIGKNMIYGMWLLVLALLTLFFNSVLDRQRNPNQTVLGLEDGGVRQVKLQRNRFGHYVASGMINDHPVVFMVDTGASDISVPAKVAERIGLKRGQELVYHTANGSARAYATMLSSVSLGPILLKKVRASINPNVDDEEILLGMSFLKYLEFGQQGQTLTLRQTLSR